MRSSERLFEGRWCNKCMFSKDEKTTWYKFYRFGQDYFIIAKLHSIRHDSFDFDKCLKEYLRIFQSMLNHCTFQFVEIFHFVEIRPVFVYIFIPDWIFLTKFRSSDPSFNRNILKSLHLKFETSAHARHFDYRLYILHTSFRHGVSWKLTVANVVNAMIVVM